MNDQSWRSVQCWVLSSHLSHISSISLKMAYCFMVWYGKSYLWLVISCLVQLLNGPVCFSCTPFFFFASHCCWLMSDLLTCYDLPGHHVCRLYSLIQRGHLHTLHKFLEYVFLFHRLTCKLAVEQLPLWILQQAGEFLAPTFLELSVPTLPVIYSPTLSSFFTCLLSLFRWCKTTKKILYTLLHFEKWTKAQKSSRQHSLKSKTGPDWPRPSCRNESDSTILQYTKVNDIITRSECYCQKSTLFLKIFSKNLENKVISDHNFMADDGRAWTACPSVKCAKFSASPMLFQFVSGRQACVSSKPWCEHHKNCCLTLGQYFLHMRNT